MVTKKRLIEVEPVIEKIRKANCADCYNCNAVLCRACLVDDFISLLDDSPAVDAVEVVHGHWVSDKADILFHCSVCETQVSTDWDYDDLSWNYCPNCGAKMDLKGE